MHVELYCIVLYYCECQRWAEAESAPENCAKIARMFGCMLHMALSELEWEGTQR